MAEGRKDILIKKESGSPKNPKKTLDKIKSSVFSRSLSLARITIGAGASLASQGISSAFSSSEKRNQKWKEFLIVQAQNFTQEVGELKGSLMKAGQMLSVYGEHFFPPEVNQFFKTLQQDSISLHWSAIEKILKERLSPEILAQLEIETEPLASASLGQVHRAKIKKSGELVALKIQYPNVDLAIESDLKAIRSFLNIIKVLPKDKNFDSLFDEIKQMLRQETDYLNEARLTEEFHQRLQNDSRFVVPRVYREFSGAKILCTSFERGLRADDPIVQSLNQERRNKIALNFLDLYLKEIFIWKEVQTDPHPGNYKIRVNPNGRDQIVLLDFGATRSYEEKFLHNYRQMIKGAVEKNIALFQSAARKLHFIKETDRPELIETFEEFCLETAEPFLSPDDPRAAGRFLPDGSYDWKNSDLPQRLSAKVIHIMKTFSWRTPPQEILFLDRKTGGVFIFLSMLRAQIRARDSILPYLQNVSDRVSND